MSDRLFSIQSKLPKVGTTIFTTMSALAKKHSAINLSQGFPDFDCDPKLKDYVVESLFADHNQYAPMSGVPDLKQAISQKIKLLYNTSIDSNSEITIVAGATQGIFTTIQALVFEDDEVIIFEPAYDSYRPSLELVGARIKSVELTYPDYSFDWDKVESMISIKTKMIIINSPHNPTGTILRSHDMERLEGLIQKYNLLLLSDEVYEHLIYDNEPHQSVLRYPSLYKRSIAIYSFGKTFHNTGWKIGYVVAPPSISAEFRKVHQFNVFSVNSFLQYAIAKFLTEKEHYLGLPEFYQNKRDLFRKLMKNSKFKAIPSKGSYFELYDYADISNLSDEEFAIELTKQVGVACIPLSPFYSTRNEHKVVRFCFAKKDETLRAAAEKLCKVKTLAIT